MHLCFEARCLVLDSSFAGSQRPNPLEDPSPQSMMEPRTQDLSNTVWACATLVHDSARLAEAISTQSVQKLHLFLNRILFEYSFYLKVRVQDHFGLWSGIISVGQFS